MGKVQFLPAVQDRIAVVIMEAMNALPFVRKGNLPAAVSALLPKGREQWTSLPGGMENKGRKTADGMPMDMAYLEKLFEKFLAIEFRKFGTGEL